MNDAIPKVLARDSPTAVEVWRLALCIWGCGGAVRVSRLILALTSRFVSWCGGRKSMAAVLADRRHACSKTWCPSHRRHGGNRRPGTFLAPSLARLYLRFEVSRRGVGAPVAVLLIITAVRGDIVRPLRLGAKALRICAAKPQLFNTRCYCRREESRRTPKKWHELNDEIRCLNPTNSPARRYIPSCTAPFVFCRGAGYMKGCTKSGATEEKQLIFVFLLHFYIFSFFFLVFLHFCIFVFLCFCIFAFLHFFIFASFFCFLHFCTFAFVMFFLRFRFFFF